MPIPKNSCKDTSSSLAGPRKSQNPGRYKPRPAPELTGARPDSLALVRRANPYPLAGTVTSCLRLDGIEKDSLWFRLLRSILIKCATDAPGSFVTGALDFPSDRSAAIEFFVTAGFTPGDAESLAGPDSPQTPP